MKKKYNFKKRLFFFLFLLLGTGGLCSAQIGECLIGCFPLNNTANDYSGYNYNGTAYNVTPTTDHLGHANGAYHFSGGGSYILLPITGYFINELTYTAWCRLTAYPVSGNLSGSTILCIGGETTDQVLIMANDPSNSSIGFGAGSWDSNAQTHHCWFGSLPPLNQWYHLAMTRDNSTLCLYIDGALICSVSSGNLTAGYSGSALNATIGTRHTPGQQDFFGDIEDVRIYDCVLNQTEIQNLSSSCIFCLDSISQQPVTQSVNVGNNAVFSVTTSSGNLNYQWQADVGFGFNNLSNAGPYSGVYTNTLTVSNVNSGMNNYNFRCVISDSLATCVDTSLSATLSILSGINENTIDNFFTVSPNPSNGKFIIHFSKTLSNSSIKILNVLGEKVYSEKFSNASINKQIELKAAQGVYFIQIKDGEKQFTRKIILQ